MTNENVQQANPKDPTINVREMIEESSQRLDDLRTVETRRLDERIEGIDKMLDERDDKYQIQFSDAKEAVNTAFVAQEKAISAALIGTKEAITKSDTTTDKRFDLLSEKIDGIGEILNKNSGQSGIYVTHSDLSIEMEKMRNYFEVTIKPVVTFMNSQTGQQKGVGMSWGVVLGAVGLISTIIGIFLVLSRFLP